MTAAGVAPFNHGNDGGGSIRIPAAHTGLVGLKPSYGRIPQYPADSPFADVMSQGVLARSVLDTALVLNATAGPDPRDWRSLPAEGRDYTIGLDAGVRGWKIGLSLDFGHVEADPEVRALVEAAAQALRGARRACRGRRATDRTPAEFLRAAVDRQLRDPASPGPDAAARQARSRLPCRGGEGPVDHACRLRADPTRRSRSSPATWPYGTRSTTCCCRQ